MKKYLWLVLIVCSCITFGQAPSDGLDKTDKKEVNVKIFPNPATSVINILGLTDTVKANIMVSDSYGNTVLRHEWEIKNHALNIPIANLEKGMYMLSILSPEQRVHTKFYKQ